MIPQSIRWQIKRWSNIHRQGPLPNVFLFSTARSGSTWVMEMVATQPGVKIIDEPLAESHWAGGRGPLPPPDAVMFPGPDRERLLDEYFRKLIANRTGIASPRPFHPFHRLVTRRIVFKILRCKDLMDWFAERFDGQLVYLLRHPVPTSLSRRYTPRAARFLANDIWCERYLEPRQRAYGEKLLETGNELERKVLDWCLQNLPPLRFASRAGWCCVHYEDIVLEPERVVRTLAERVQLEHVDRMLARVTVASGSSNQSDAETRDRLASGAADRHYLVERWRERVDAEEERRLFDILDAFELDVYRCGNPLPANPVT